MDQALKLDRWLVYLGNLRDMGDGEALRFYMNRTKQKFPGSAQSHARAFEALERSAASLEAVDRQHGRGAALNLSHRTVIQSLAVKGHRYTLGMAENARRCAFLQVP
ncbi:hypothetical protein [Rhizobium sp. WSM1325]|uniref:hypothetical protein n=1 Tax=Rhizobium sp. WSM1325 TaxID=3444086 RepID=UPI000FEF86C5|nr:hypothetical protein [Rhizobium leguminosarum]RWY80892.1 hypothetical protein EHI48_05640 [Rhizobium leguminosarum]